MVHLTTIQGIQIIFDSKRLGLWVAIKVASGCDMNVLQCNTRQKKILDWDAIIQLQYEPDSIFKEATERIPQSS